MAAGLQLLQLFIVIKSLHVQLVEKINYESRQTSTSVNAVSVAV